MNPLSTPATLPMVVVVIGAVGLYATLSTALAVRHSRPRLAGRVTAVVLVAVGMVGLALQPHWERQRSDRPVVLVTKGAPVQVVDSLHRAMDDAVVVALGDTAWRRRALGDREDPVTVVGFGLAPYQWADFDGRVDYRAALVPDGLVDVAWRREIVLGRELVVEGRVRASDTSWIVLTGPGGDVDSAQVGPEDGGFRVRDRPRSVGQHLYRLTVRSDPAASHGVGVSVVPPPVVRVLVLADRPGFSTRYLRDWLAERGAALAIRMQVSQSRYRFEFVNLPERQFETITATTLAGVDIVIVDAQALANLSNRETGRLRDAVEREGIGLLAVVGTVPEDGVSARLLHGFRFAALSDDLDERAVGPRWVDGLRDSVLAVPAYPWVITPGRVARPLMWDGTGQVVAAVGLRGAGRVGVTVIAEPERWVRRGESVIYGEYWAQLMSALTEGRRGDRWDVGQDGPVMANRPVSLALLSDEAAPRAFVRAPSGRDERLALVQDTLNMRRWRALYWPREAGWYQVRASGDSLSLHVTARDGWDAWDASQRVMATTRRAALQPVSAALSPPTPQPHPFPLAWFWLLTLAAASYLWAEDKLFN